MNVLLYLTWQSLPWIALVYIIAGSTLTILKGQGAIPHPRWNTLWKWTKWPAFMHVVAGPLLDIMFVPDVPWFIQVLWLTNAYCWWVFRNAGDDDITRKLKEKATEMVERVGSKLVVVAVAR